VTVSFLRTLIYGINVYPDAIFEAFTAVKIEVEVFLQDLELNVDPVSVS
jgi:hypothetical protein